MESTCTQTQPLNPRPPAHGGHRCACRRLLARSAPAGAVEVKCSRCRRVLTLDVEGEGEDVRCSCGRLLARRVVVRSEPQLRLRCPRCKRHHDVDGRGSWHPVPSHDT